MKIIEILTESTLEKIIKAGLKRNFTKKEDGQQLLLQKKIKFNDTMFILKYKVNMKTESWVLIAEDEDGVELKELSSGESLQTLENHMLKKHHVYKRQLQNI